LDLSVLFPEASRDVSPRQIARAASGEYCDSVKVPILRKDMEAGTALGNSANIHGSDSILLVATMAQGTTSPWAVAHRNVEHTEYYGGSRDALASAVGAGADGPMLEPGGPQPRRCGGVRLDKLVAVC